MAIRIFNTLSKRKETLVPVEQGKVKFYLCGPTVYDYFHIGNARPFIVFDVFRRYLEYRGYDVRFVVNLTDIDDKIIKKANVEGIPAGEVARKYSRAYFEDAEKLGIRRADVHPRATDHVSDIIKLIQILVDNGYAYQVNGDVYYDVSKFKNYGQLSGKKIDELQSGARVEVDERKKAPLDFALWKAAKPGEPWWESPWGKGRPGWHIECSAMSMKYLGETFDIHAGAIDLIFPHHENEIAQSEGATGKKFVNYWMHIGFLNLGDEKMSKSLGNIVSAREVLKTYRPEVIRLFFLLKHYRSPISFSEEILQEARSALQRVHITLKNIDTVLDSREDWKIEDKTLTQEEKTFLDSIERTGGEFIEAMDDDFNSAVAISKLFDLVKEANRILAKDEITVNEKVGLYKVKQLFWEFNAFLGILVPSLEAGETATSSEVDALIEILVDTRNRLRSQRQWTEADRIRSRLKEIGIILEDRDNETVWRRELK